MSEIKTQEDKIQKCKNEKILICVPTQEIARIAEFYDWMDLLLKPRNCDVLTSRVHGQSPARNRNLAIKQALANGCDYVFFVDDDCFHPPDTLIKLYNRMQENPEVNVVTGLYLMRNHPHQPIIFNLAMDDGKCAWYNLTNNNAADNATDNGLIEVVAAGLGGCLVKIEVFKKIAEKHEYWVTLGELENDHWCDDLSFYKRVREAGYKIHCDLSAPIGHNANVTIWPSKDPITGEWQVVYDTKGQSRVAFPFTKITSIPQMKAPSDKRPTWRNGVIQVHITRACDLSCTGCTQGSNLAGKPVVMSLEHFEESVKSLQGYFGVVGIFGGNPCLHPKFEQICDILTKYIPYEQRGLWSNNLNGYGSLCRYTFNPEVSNLNVHGDKKAYDYMKYHWPECNPLGELADSRHTPPYVALKDMEDMDDKERWQLIADCDINKFWSAMICVFRDQLRGFFCELAGAQSMLHEADPEYPDTGVKIDENWWKQDIKHFGNQVLKHCMECGIPLRAAGDMADGEMEFVSKTHLDIYKLKRPVGHVIRLVKNRQELYRLGTVDVATNYIQNGLLQVIK